MDHSDTLPPDGIPQDVWEAAIHWWREGGCSTGDATTYARAIMAEREWCATIAADFPNMGAASGREIAAIIRVGRT